MKLAQVRKIALALPEVSEAPHFAFTSFRIRGKIFATAPPGDEYLHVFVADEERELALAMERSYVEKLFWGGKVCGLRVVLPKAKPKIVAELLMRAWTHKAPKKLVLQRQASTQ